MKTEFKRLARLNGQQAKLKARRMVTALKLHQVKGGQWLKTEAAHLARRVDFHLRQAHLIGRYIEQIEEQERQAQKAAKALDRASRRATDTDAQGKA